MSRNDNDRGNPITVQDKGASIGGRSHNTIDFYPGGPNCVVDGTYGAVLTADSGTDGRTQCAIHTYTHTQDEKVFLNFTVPNDYHSQGILELYFTVSATTATHTIVWTGTAQAIPFDKTVAVDTTGTTITAVTKTVGYTNTTLGIKCELDIARVITMTPGDYATLMIVRDVSEETCTVACQVYAYRFTYLRG